MSVVPPPPPTSHSLPSPNQTWSHCTITPTLLLSALTSHEVTAIEADILMSEDGTSPVMAHPPSRASNLPFSTFLQSCFSSEHKPKHIKCDFKELAVVKPCLAQISALLLKRDTNSDSQPRAIFLNADVLPGPGKRDSSTVDADEFVQTCLEHRPVQALSLGWSTNVTRVYNPLGYYLTTDIDAMVALVDKYNLTAVTPGIVFAVNCRLVARDPSTMVDLLAKVPTSQLLLWVGSGEPTISQNTVDHLKAYFGENGCGDRIGFDCQISETAVEAMISELKIGAINVINRIRGL
jgi:hypothetical protein